MEARSTQVYLIRHGIAAERGTYPDDSQRPLIKKGVLRTTNVAQRLTALGLKFDTILTSPLVRAKQTAKILQQAGLAKGYEVSTELAPNGNLSPWLLWLEHWQNQGHTTLALVGHEPDLSRWAQHLVHGSRHDQWILKKAGIIGLAVPKAQQALGRSHLFWLAPPKFII